MKARIYDNGGRTADRYIVIIGNDVYTMSDDAMMPNGFNQYAGHNISCPGWNVTGIKGHVPVSFDSLPTQVQCAIEARKL